MDNKYEFAIKTLHGQLKNLKIQEETANRLISQNQIRVIELQQKQYKLLAAINALTF